VENVLLFVVYVFLEYIPYYFVHPIDLGDCLLEAYLLLHR